MFSFLDTFNDPPIARIIGDAVVSPVQARIENRRLRREYPWVEALRSVPEAVTATGHGYSRYRQMLMLQRLGLGRGQDLMLLGVGTGNEIRDWIAMHPRSILAGDVRKLEAAWEILRTEAKSRDIPVEFRQMDACNLPVPDESIDLVASHTMLEHIVDVPGHLREVRRVLRPGGSYYCVFGPVWTSYEGPHAESNGFEHLRMSYEAWRTIGRTRVADDDHYMYEVDCFNRWNYAKYDALFSEIFRARIVALYLSAGGIEWRKQHPTEWDELLAQTALAEADLLCKSAIVILRKPAVAAK